jgi:pimeloyl-ACP methyl ester carboxylesterase
MHIHWESHGIERGPAVVLVQGLGLSSRFWFDQPQRLAKRGRVITLDNRGTGRSDKPRRPYRLPQMADDVARVIREANAGPAIVVGISMGGMIAQHVAMRHPRDVRALVLLATTPGHPHGTFPAPRALATLLRAPSQRRNPAALREFNRLLLPEHELDNAHVHLSRWPEALAQDPLAMQTFVRHFLAVMTNWTGANVARIEHPAIVVHGEDDILVPPRNGETLAKLIPRAELMMLPRVAHAVPTLVPDIIERALERLAEHERKVA